MELRYWMEIAIGVALGAALVLGAPAIIGVLP